MGNERLKEKEEKDTRKFNERKRERDTKTHIYRKKRIKISQSRTGKTTTAAVTAATVDSSRLYRKF